MQGFLPFFPKDFTQINSIVGYQVKDQTVWYFNHMMPYFSHHVDDLASFRMIVCQMYQNGIAKQAEMARCFKVDKSSIKRWVKKYKSEGAAAFGPRTHEKKGHVLTPRKLKEAQSHLDSGMAPAEVGREMGLLPDTIRKAITGGRLRKGSTEKKTDPGKERA